MKPQVWKYEREAFIAMLETDGNYWTGRGMNAHLRPNEEFRPITGKA